MAKELAKNIKTPEDLNQFDRLLKKISVEAGLNVSEPSMCSYNTTLGMSTYILLIALSALGEVKYDFSVKPYFY